MNLRILHTSDLHIGLKFTRGYSDDVVQKLSEARLTVVSRLVEVANREKCNLFVVAGDLFDNLRIAKSTVRQVAAMLRRFDGVVAVLPGNHDYVQQSDDPIWPTFQDALGEGHLLLTENRPYDLSTFDLPGILFPGPCRSRHSQTNSIGWVKGAIESMATSCLKIGVAHGSL